MITNSGIYKIKNIITGDFYIGSSCNIERRFYQHHQTLVKNTHRNLHLQRVWNKYGADNFLFGIILYCEPSELTCYEQALVDSRKPAYNMCLKCVDSSRGIKRSAETRLKMSEAKSGERHPNFGKPMSEEQKQKISVAHKGRPNGCLGYKHSEETRAKMRSGVVSEETCMKLSKSTKKVWALRREAQISLRMLYDQ